MKNMLIAGAFSVVSLVATAAEQAAPAYPAGLQTLVDDKIVEVMETRVVNDVMTAYVVSQPRGATQIIYGMKGMDDVLVGTLLDKNGASIHEELKLLNPSRDYSADEHALDDLATVTTNNAEGKPDFFVFYDANCGYCKKLYTTIRDENIDVAVHWAPVGLIGEGSWKVAVEWLESEDPAAFLEAIQERSLVAEITRKPDSEFDPGLRDRVDQNLKIARLFDVTGTPAVAWKRKDGKLMMLRGALPGNSLKTVVENTADIR